VIESCIESGMKCIPQVVDIETLLIMVFDGLDGRQLALVDLAHEFSRSLFFINDFLNFGIEERLLCSFDCTLEPFPVFQISCHFILVQRTSTLFIPPTLGMLHEVDSI